ncbi:hypothetical protein L5157_000290 [Vibrio parahaemolyticus]|uniref:DUF6279 family lipoprotein n=1 Tax=Vibrio parahaemolyticus TaxID=670 RepID=UPI001C4E46B4|nr:DUF6279 family lipoprotein [Vibrio parahaemolyticus]EIU6818781.1 hypothetical protein [Vibrio parahaemolyticus]ELI5394299.1 hypothetical protein [Vibrio parahaemolyticus]HCG6556510.1 hypothetical protein [Vibrio parahaemolyticus]
MIKLSSLSNKVLQYGFVFLLVILLAGCTKKFLYSNIDWFVIEYLDDYVSLNDEQETLLEERLLLLADWHKKEELPLYIDHLKELENINANNITLAFLQKNREKMKAHYDRIVSRSAPDLFSLSLQLTPKQQQEFLQNVRKDYQERNAKYADKTEAETREIILENTEEWMEEWIGELNSDQKRYAKQISQQTILNSPLWRNYRASIYQELEYLFENQSNSVVYQQVFMQLLFEPESYYSEQLSENIDHNLGLVDQLTLNVAKSMTDKQWFHFRNKVKEWRVLAEELQD